MKYIRLLFVPMLLFCVALMNIGGCSEEQSPSCLLPPLNTNFSDELYILFDDSREITMGISSDGQEVAISLTDSFGTTIGGIASVFGEYYCFIASAYFQDQVPSNARGLCERSVDGEFFSVDNFSIEDTLIYEFTEGRCVEVTQAGTNGENRSANFESVVSDYHNKLIRE